MATIREKLAARNKSLGHRADTLILQSKNIADHAPSSFPTATSHGRDHLETVEQIGNLLLPDLILNKLTDRELFFLLLAFYYHDLGMVGEEWEFSTEKGREKIRRQHAISVGTKIIERWEELGFENENEARILADICRGHRPKKKDGIANWNTLDEVKPVGPGESIRLRLISAMIYATDELHLGDDRAKEKLRNWIKLENEESRRHWTRHSFISGPVSRSDGSLLFDATIKTFSCESDLRRNVFAKAFSAVRDLNSQLATEGFEEKVSLPTVQWDRSELWKLLCIMLAGERNHIGQDDLVNAVQDGYDVERGNYLDLSELCKELGNDIDSTRPRIIQAVDQLRSQDVLVHGEGTTNLMLETSRQASEFIGRLVRDADELDVLFKGKFAGNHEFDLFCSEFGQRLVSNQVIPEIVNFYGFDPRKHPRDQDIIEVLKASPSAARFAMELKPIPSELVKRRLLATVIIGGFSRDCLQNPQLILRKSVRDAFKNVVGVFTSNYDRTIEFYEELALLGGFDAEKLSEIIRRSDEWKEENSKLLPPEWADAKVSVSQSMAPGQPQPTTSFPYFLLAGLRSGNHVELRCNYESSISVDTSSLPDVEGQKPVEQRPAPSSIAIGPAEAQRLPFFDVRCSILFSQTSKRLSLKAVELADSEHRDFPLVLSLPRPDLAKEGESKLNFGFNLSRLTVKDALNLRQYSKSADKNDSDISVTLLKTGQVFVTLTSNPGSNWSKVIDFEDELIDRLARYDPSLSLPWFILKQHERLILESNPEEIGSVMNEIKKELDENKHEIATFILIEEDENSVPFREQWLGFYPGLQMNAPEMDLESNKSEYSNSDIAALWEQRKGNFKLETKLREDTAAITKSFLDWADSEGKDDWPISIDSTIPTFHQAKTVYSMIRRPFIDRFWYLEAPNELVVRPTTLVERMETEMRYWESVGDTDRQQLVKEKLERIQKSDANEPATRNSEKQTKKKSKRNPMPILLDKKADKKRKRKLEKRQKRTNRK